MASKARPPRRGRLGLQGLGCSRKSCGPLLLFAVIHPPDSADDAAQRPHTFFVGEENLSDAARAVVPALENREMLHSFEGRFNFWDQEAVNGFFDPRLH